MSDFGHMLHKILGVDPEDSAQMVFDLMIVGYVCFDEKLDLVALNPQARALIGLEPDIHISSQDIYSQLDYLCPGGAAVLERALVSCLENNERVDFDLGFASASPPIPSWLELRIRQVVHGDKRVLLTRLQDISQYKDAIAQRELFWERTEKLTHNMPFSVNIWDENMEIIYCNKKTLERYGFQSIDEYISGPVNWKHISPEFQPCGRSSKEMAYEMREKTLREGSVQFEWMHHHPKDKTPIPSEIWMIREDFDGKTHILSYTSDLREMRSIIEAEREAAEYQKSLMEASPLSLEIWDENLNLIDCNQKTVGMSGAGSKSEYIKNHRKFMPEYQPDGQASRYKELKLLGHALREGFCQTEWMMMNAEGNLVPVDCMLVRISRGGKFFVAWYSHDISMVKMGMAKAFEREERQRMLIEALPSPCFLFDQKFGVVDCNHAAVELFAKPPGEPFNITDNDGTVISCNGECQNCALYTDSSCVARKYLAKHPEKIFYGHEADPDIVRKFLGNHFSKTLINGRSEFTFDTQTLDGDIVPCNCVMVAEKYRGNRVFACYMTDLRSEIAREAAEEESRVKTRFLARMSHEIRTPMNAIMGITEIQLNKGTSPETYEAFAQIQSSSKVLLNLINDILDLSSIEALKIQVVPVPYQVASLISDVVQLNIMGLGSKRIDFKLDVDENLPVHLIGDEFRIKQVLSNLLSNAFKYTDSGEVRLSISAGCSLLQDHKFCLAVVVEDTGQGMTPEQTQQLFNREFTRFNLENNRNIEGTGLGMNIAYALVKLMDGEIKVKSELGVGSRFTLEIPQRVEYPDEVLGRELAENLENFRLMQSEFSLHSKIKYEAYPHGRVLVVDDVEINLYVAQGMLEPYKLHVECVTRGKDAVDLIAAGRVYDIVFMDHMMPGLDGVESTRLIRQMGYEKPIIALTANAIVGQSDMFLENGFSGFISKPIDTNLLDAFIRKHIPPSSEVGDPHPETNTAETTPREAEESYTRQLEKFFMRDAARALEVLEPTLKLENPTPDELREVKISAHAMKSALENVGKSNISPLAAALESAAEKNDIPAVKVRGTTLIFELKTLIEEFSQNSEPVCTRQEDTQALVHVLTKFADAAVGYDIEGADNALFELSRLCNSAKSQDIHDRLAAKVLHAEYEEAAKLAWDWVGAGVNPH